MRTVGLFDAKARLSEIVRDAEAGKSTVITRNGTPVAHVVPITAKKHREFGFDDGLGYIADDFDAPLPDDILAQFTK